MTMENPYEIIRLALKMEPCHPCSGGTSLKLDLAAQEIKNSYPAASDFYFFSSLLRFFCRRIWISGTNPD